LLAILVKSIAITIAIFGGKSIATYLLQQPTFLQRSIAILLAILDHDLIHTRQHNI